MCTLEWVGLGIPHIHKLYYKSILIKHGLFQVTLLSCDTNAERNVILPFRLFLLNKVQLVALQWANSPH